MAHRKLTALSIVGLVISVGLWAVSQIGLTYVPSSQTQRLLLHSGVIELAGLPPRVSIKAFCGDLAFRPGRADRTGQFIIDWCSSPSYDLSRPQSYRSKYGNWSFAPGFSMRLPSTAPMPWTPRCGRIIDDLASGGYGGVPTLPVPPITFISGSWMVRLPLWIPALLLAIMPTRLVFIRYRARRRLRRGLCASCGYDLRASISRCPECGEAFDDNIFQVMRRKKRRHERVFLVVSLTGLALSIGLWGVSYLRVSYSSESFSVYCGAGGLRFQPSDGRLDADGFRAAGFLGWKTFWRPHARIRSTSVRNIWVPLWIPAALCAGYLSFVLLRTALRRRHGRLGLCER